MEAIVRTRSQRTPSNATKLGLSKEAFARLDPRNMLKKTEQPVRIVRAFTKPKQIISVATLSTDTQPKHSLSGNENDFHFNVSMAAFLNGPLYIPS